MNLANERPALAEMTELYEAARYMDLWQLSRHLWLDRDLLRRLSIDELLLAGRLASRLGNDRWYRAMMRLAKEREPNNLRVRCYARSATACASKRS